MRNDKGITLLMLVIYIILTIIVLGIVSTIAMNFRKNLNDLDVKTVQDIEFDKLNVQLLQETKNEINKIITNESTATKLVFKSGNTYEYKPEEEAIYLNNNIKVADNIEKCTFEIKETKSASINVRNETAKYVDKFGKVATIPAGFAVSGRASEQSIEDGLVIYCGLESTKQRLIATVEINGEKRTTEYILSNNGEIDWTNDEEYEEAKKTYDQFVWIPIKNTSDDNVEHTGDINDMYICQNKGQEGYDATPCKITVENGQAVCKVHGDCTQMAGRLYATSNGELFEKAYTEVYTENDGLREPDVVTDNTSGTGTGCDGSSTYLNQLNGILGKSYKTAAEFKADLQKEYNEIVESVYTNQGYYVGRYETSNMVDTDTPGQTVKVVAGTTNGINLVTWYRMYAEQVNYAKNKGLTSVGSSMIQGAAYDQEMKFVETESYNIKKSGNVGHGSTQKLTAVYQTGGLNYTGSVSYKDCSKNIYDLEGNVFQWTTEACFTHDRVVRGGTLYEGNSASCRYGFYPIFGSSSDNRGSQLQLYIK